MRVSFSVQVGLLWGLVCVASSACSSSSSNPSPSVGGASEDVVRGIPGDIQEGALKDVSGDLVEDVAEDVLGDAPEDVAPDQAASLCEDLASAYVTNPNPAPDPLYSGTVWFDPHIIVAQDPSSFQSLSYKGQQLRQMYDRRTASFNMENPHLFDAVFGAQSQVVVEIQVNPEFDQLTAQGHAQRYAEVVGKLPAFYFRDLQTMWIHAGKELFGGGNNNFLIHVEQGEEYERDGVLEEVFLHEGGHTSLDAYHASAPLWSQAQSADGVSISNYGRDYPVREDLSETIGPYLAVTYRADRLPAEKIDTLRASIPNRLKYLSCQGFDMQILK